MPGWNCPDCHTENGILDMECKACGKSRVGTWGAGISRSISSSPMDSIHGRSRSILDEIKTDLARSGGASGRVFDAPAADMPDASALTAADRQNIDLDELLPSETEFPDLISSAELGPGDQPQYAGRNLDQLMKSMRAPTFERTVNRGLEVKINSMPRLNYSLVHCGFPLISSLKINNNSRQPVKNVVLKIWLAPDYSEPWQKSIPDILPGKKHVEKKLQLPLVLSRLQRIREAEEACLRIDVLAEGQLYFSDTYPMEVLAYNEWYLHPDHAETLACFVRPNSEAIEKIINHVRDRLRRENKDTTLCGYQMGKPEKVMEMLEALYNTLQQDLNITYINHPPSFERGITRWGGIPSSSQKVIFAEEIYENRRGTCLDLALLCAVLPGADRAESDVFPDERPRLLRILDGPAHVSEAGPFAWGIAGVEETCQVGQTGGHRQPAAAEFHDIRGIPAATVLEMSDRRAVSDAGSQGFQVRHRRHSVPPGGRETFAVMDRGPI